MENILLNDHLNENILLKKQLNEIEKQYLQLTEEYNENTIICSMNDMKTMYDIQQKEIKNLKNIIYEMRDQNKTVKNLIDIIIKNLRQYKDLFTIQSRLEFLKEIY